MEVEGAEETEVEETEVEEVEEAEEAEEEQEKGKGVDRSAPFHSSSSSSENEDEIEGNRLSAQLALEEDPNEAHLLRMIEETKGHPPTRQKWLTALANHRVEKAADPQAAAVDAARWRRTHADIGRKLLSTEQYHQAMGWTHGPTEPPLPAKRGPFKNIPAYSILRYPRPPPPPPSPRPPPPPPLPAPPQPGSTTTRSGRVTRPSVRAAAAAAAAAEAEGVEEAGPVRRRPRAAAAEAEGVEEAGPARRRPRAESTSLLVKSPRRKQARRRGWNDE